MTWKFQQIKPQKARGKLDPDMWTDPNWVGEVKYDGDRRIAQFCSMGAVRFTGTRESVDGTGFVEKTGNLPHLSGAAEPYAKRSTLVALTGTVLDGEIVAPWAKKLPGGKSKYVTSIMGSDPERAIELQKRHGWLEYMVFDCLWYKGTDVRGESLERRRVYVLDALGTWKNKYATQAEQIRGSNKEKYFQTLLKQGEEGVVLKRLDHTYGDEKLWVKVKGTWTADVVVTGFEPGKGKYVGSVGAIKFSQYVYTRPPGTKSQVELIEYGTCRGFTDALMNQMTMNPKKYVGKVIEIQHFGREPTGAFRSPQFKRFRDDKNSKDCVYDPEET